MSDWGIISGFLNAFGYFYLWLCMGVIIIVFVYINNQLKSYFERDIKDIIKEKEYKTLLMARKPVDWKYNRPHSQVFLNNLKISYLNSRVKRMTFVDMLSKYFADIIFFTYGDKEINSPLIKYFVNHPVSWLNDVSSKVDRYRILYQKSTTDLYYPYFQELFIEFFKVTGIQIMDNYGDGIIED